MQRQQKNPLSISCYTCNRSYLFTVLPLFSRFCYYVSISFSQHILCLRIFFMLYWQAQNRQWPLLFFVVVIFICYFFFFSFMFFFLNKTSFRKNCNCFMWTESCFQLCLVLLSEHVWAILFCPFIWNDLDDVPINVRQSLFKAWWQCLRTRDFS